MNFLIGVSIALMLLSGAGFAERPHVDETSRPTSTDFTQFGIDFAQGVSTTAGEFTPLEQRSQDMDRYYRAFVFGERSLLEGDFRGYTDLLLLDRIYKTDPTLDSETAVRIARDISDGLYTHFVDHPDLLDAADHTAHDLSSLINTVTSASGWTKNPLAVALLAKDLTQDFVKVQTLVNQQTAAQMPAEMGKQMLGRLMLEALAPSSYGEGSSRIQNIHQLLSETDPGGKKEKAIDAAMQNRQRGNGLTTPISGMKKDPHNREANSDWTEMKQDETIKGFAKQLLNIHENRGAKKTNDDSKKTKKDIDALAEKVAGDVAAIKTSAAKLKAMADEAEKQKEAEKILRVESQVHGAINIFRMLGNNSKSVNEVAALFDTVATLAACVALLELDPIGSSLKAIQSILSLSSSLSNVPTFEQSVMAQFQVLKEQIESLQAQVNRNHAQLVNRLSNGFNGMERHLRDIERKLSTNNKLLDERVIGVLGEIRGLQQQNAANRIDARNNHFDDIDYDLEREHSYQMRDAKIPADSENSRKHISNLVQYTTRHSLRASGNPEDLSPNHLGESYYLASGKEPLPKRLTLLRALHEKLGTIAPLPHAKRQSLTEKEGCSRKVPNPQIVKYGFSKYQGFQLERPDIFKYYDGCMKAHDGGCLCGVPGDYEVMKAAVDTDADFVWELTHSTGKYGPRGPVFQPLDRYKNSVQALRNLITDGLGNGQAFKDPQKAPEMPLELSHLGNCATFDPEKRPLNPQEGQEEEAFHNSVRQKGLQETLKEKLNSPRTPYFELKPAEKEKIASLIPNMFRLAQQMKKGRIDVCYRDYRYCDISEGKTYYIGKDQRHPKSGKLCAFISASFVNNNSNSLPIFDILATSPRVVDIGTEVWESDPSPGFEAALSAWLDLVNDDSIRWNYKYDPNNENPNKRKGHFEPVSFEHNQFKREMDTGFLLESIIEQKGQQHADTVKNANESLQAVTQWVEDDLKEQRKDLLEKLAAQLKSPGGDLGTILSDINGWAKVVNDTNELALKYPLLSNPTLDALNKSLPTEFDILESLRTGLTIRHVIAVLDGAKAAADTLKTEIETTLMIPTPFATEEWVKAHEETKDHDELLQQFEKDTKLAHENLGKHPDLVALEDEMECARDKWCRISTPDLSPRSSQTSTEPPKERLRNRLAKDLFISILPVNEGGKNRYRIKECADKKQTNEEAFERAKWIEKLFARPPILSEEAMSLIVDGIPAAKKIGHVLGGNSLSICYTFELGGNDATQTFEVRPVLIISYKNDEPNGDNESTYYRPTSFSLSESGEHLFPLPVSEMAEYSVGKHQLILQNGGQFAPEERPDEIGKLASGVRPSQFVEFQDMKLAEWKQQRLVAIEAKRKEELQLKDKQTLVTYAARFGEFGDHFLMLASASWPTVDNPLLQDARAAYERLRPVSALARQALDEGTAKFHEARKKIKYDDRWVHFRRSKDRNVEFSNDIAYRGWTLLPDNQKDRHPDKKRDRPRIETWEFGPYRVTLDSWRDLDDREVKVFTRILSHDTQQWPKDQTDLWRWFP